MERLNVLYKVRLFLPMALIFVVSTAFSQQNTAKDSRSEIIYKQIHSSSLSDKKTNLFADGLKLKMDLSVIEEAEAAREEWDTSEIPADGIYGGIWNGRTVDVYGSSVNAPDSFRVNLSNFTMPCYGFMTSNFGRRGSRRYHHGVDLKAQTGDTIYAAFDGKIRVRNYERGGYGYYIVIRHPNGLETVYGHLSKFIVRENQVVRSGQPIGLAGNTGRSFGSHLHFETRFLGRPINPNFIVDFNNKVCHRDEYLVTNSSYRKTSTKSSYVIRSEQDYNNYKKAANSNNKYVSGGVKYHRIKSGDNLGAIARRYGVSVKKLCNLNNMTSATTLRAGKSIRVS